MARFIIKKFFWLSVLSASAYAGCSYRVDRTYNPTFYRYHERLVKMRGFGGWSIAKELFDRILTILPAGSTLLELGSGWASGEFSKHYTVYSIEHDPFFLNKYNTNYIYAPIVDRWYDCNILIEDLPEKYDLILVDGPVGRIGRYDFLTHIDLFRPDVPIIIDDVNRKEEYRLLVDLAAILQRPYEIFKADNKQYAIIYL